MSFWIVIGVIVAIGLWLIAVYNGLVGSRNQSQTAWSQIDVQLKRRHDLIPNLVQVVKDAMGYEQETLTKVVQARNAAAAATGPAQSGPAEAALSQATKGLFALVEGHRSRRPGSPRAKSDHGMVWWAAGDKRCLFES